MKISNAGLQIIKDFEGFSSTPYKDSGGVCTIGYGTTFYPTGRKVECTDVPINESVASDLMRNMIDELYGKKVNEAIGDTPTTQEQFDAMVSLAYNIGTEAFKNSTLLKHHLKQEYELASNEFVRWNKAGGKTINGLTRRREEEQKLYETIA